MLHVPRSSYRACQSAGGRGARGSPCHPASGAPEAWHPRERWPLSAPRRRAFRGTRIARPQDREALSLQHPPPCSRKGHMLGYPEVSRGWTPGRPVSLVEPQSLIRRQCGLLLFLGDPGHKKVLAEAGSHGKPQKHGETSEIPPVMLPCAFDCLLVKQHSSASGSGPVLGAGRWGRVEWQTGHTPTVVEFTSRRRQETMSKDRKNNFQIAASVAKIQSVVMGWSCRGLGAWGGCSNLVVREASWRR